MIDHFFVSSVQNQQGVKYFVIFGMTSGNYDSFYFALNLIYLKYIISY